ncbi:helicase HerA domain-containing protein [Rhodohalobacter sp. 614A]|uniref:helicase HerA domain-containing protein n=1 Tax=Rhodohalobacter sp. 614A TaxID=2908649 RepID=UPI001F457C9D|nr:DUF87 domain-containing protein [Rhodohalobacter sp. 614A]
MKLTIKQRFLAAFIYLGIILFLGLYFSGDTENIFDTTSKWNYLLIVTALSLVLGSYIIEPFFSRPVEVVARWVAILLFLFSISEQNEFLLYDYWIYVSIFFLVTALLLIFLYQSKNLVKSRKVLTDIICKISRPEIIFSILYFFIVASFFTDSIPDFEYALLIGFGFLLLINKPVNYLVLGIWRTFSFLTSSKETGEELGQVIGHDSIDFYKVEITGDTLKGLKSLKGELVYLESDQKGIIGIVVDEKYLVGKRWAYIFSLRGNENNFITFDLKSFEPLSGEKTIYSKTHSVKHIKKDDLEDVVKEKVERNSVYKNFKNFIGYVWKGSTIKQIRFLTLFDSETLGDKNIGEGTILETSIVGKSVLYQIIDGRTEEEDLEKQNSHGYTIGTAQKLGEYDTTNNELETVKWLPEIYTPIFLLEPEEIEYDASRFIGRLPKTNYGFPIKEPDTLVTHNTAILGILGIGKSCLTFELLQKLILSTNVKIFCIDLTNQYQDSLPKYISDDLIEIDISESSKQQLRHHKGAEDYDNPETWGNESLYKSILDDELSKFDQSGKRIFILNPDWHRVEKAGSKYKVTYKDDLTPAEKTRIISERIFLMARSKGETTDAKYLMVFEEAHSLVPEWNSVANEGDKSATNGTAKVILQGRKFGMGSMVVTQRTANISKSILNQCNTIFALRVFDDTGKQFLENYIGSEYSNVLPTLEERHAVVTGKALKLKQPVIMELNDRKEVADYNEDE